MPGAEFESTTPVFGRMKTVPEFDTAAAVIGSDI
jgi:hypothetical protein